MNDRRFLPLLLASAAVAAAAGVASHWLLAPEPRPAAGVQAADVEELRASLAALAREQQVLATSVEKLSTSVALRGTSQRAAVDDLGQEIERYLSARAAGDPADAPAQELDTSPAPQGTFTSSDPRVQEALARLLDPNLDDTARQSLWRELSAQGMTEALIAAFEERALREPNDPERQVELGHAYLQKIFEVGSSPLAGKWATKADQAFDAALALDERNWEARFSKAVSLSFWPPMFGKQTEAIAHFEVLVGQQAGLPKNPRHAQTHLLLGNMHQQMGAKEKAVAAWQAGLAAYPGDPALQKQIQLAQGH